MKNQLLEAAAEILRGSQSGAPGMPLQKSPQGFEELGGDTPQEHSDEVLDPHAKQATAPGKQPSSDTKAPMLTVAGKPAAATDPEDEGEPASPEAKERKARIEAGLVAGQLKEEEDRLVFTQQLKEDVAAILASETGLPQEFAAKIGTIYEARVTDKVLSIQEAIEADYEEKFADAVIEVREELTEQVNDYLDYVVEEWMLQNELAIEKGLRSELTEEFIGGLRSLFEEHYIDIPTEKVDVVDELATKVEELTSQLNEEVAKSIELKKQLGESKKTEIINGICEGLTQTQVEKVRTLAESVEFTADGDYKTKVSTIRENYFPVTSGKKTDSNAKMLTEVSEPLAEEKLVSSDAGVAAVAAAITQALK